MRLFKLIGIGALGAVIAVFLYTTLIMKHNHVVMVHDESGGIRYFVDDGTVFESPVACAEHCHSRSQWNLQNTVEIRCGEGVTLSDAQRLEECMMLQHVYPRSLVKETGLMKKE
jgi:hypothetical protein